MPFCVLVNTWALLFMLQAHVIINEYQGLTPGEIRGGKDNKLELYEPPLKRHVYINDVVTRHVLI